MDESYEITAEFAVPEGGTAGLFLFYNQAAKIGLDGGAPRCALRIRNERNVASTWKKAEGGDWELIEEGIDVSSFHHNNYNGFFALRPAYLLGGGAELSDFEYKPL